MLKVQMMALRKGYVCSKPVIEGSRYDLIIDTGDGLLRAQVKYCDRKPSHSSSAVSVLLRNANGADKSYTGSDIDVLFVYVPATDKVYKIPVDVISGKRELCLRLEPPKNNQVLGIHLADNYAF